MNLTELQHALEHIVEDKITGFIMVNIEGADNWSDEVDFLLPQEVKYMLSFFNEGSHTSWVNQHGEINYELAIERIATPSEETSKEDKDLPF